MGDDVEMCHDRATASRAVRAAQVWPLRTSDARGSGASRMDFGNPASPSRPEADDSLHMNRPGGGRSCDVTFVRWCPIAFTGRSVRY